MTIFEWKCLQKCLRVQIWPESKNNFKNRFFFWTTRKMCYSTYKNWLMRSRFTAAAVLGSRDVVPEVDCNLFAVVSDFKLKKMKITLNFAPSAWFLSLSVNGKNCSYIRSYKVWVGIWIYYAAIVTDDLGLLVCMHLVAALNLSLFYG